MNKARQFNRIVVLTGAGVSAESGLKTFRDNDGLWEGHRVEEVATPEAYQQNPETVHRFYNARRMQLLNEASANTAHQALARFENSYSSSFLLVTQNVDNLHEQAGSMNVQHMHGELLKSSCTHCGHIEPCFNDLNSSSICTKCAQTGTLRPDIVWFGEMPKFMDEIARALSEADLFVSIGTSGNVYPAAGFVQSAKASGATTIELNLEETNSPYFDLSIQGKASQLVSDFFE